MIDFILTLLRHKTTFRDSKYLKFKHLPCDEVLPVDECNMLQGKVVHFT